MQAPVSRNILSSPSNRPYFADIAAYWPKPRAMTPQFGGNISTHNVQEAATPEEKAFGNRLSAWLKAAITPVSVVVGGYLLNNRLQAKMDLIRDEVRKGFPVRMPIAAPPTAKASLSSLQGAGLMLAGVVVALGGIGGFGYQFVQVLRGGRPWV